MGHCSLNKYLHHFNIAENPNCECEEGHEMVEHYLLNCELYEKERDRLRMEAGIEGMRVSKLLGDPKLIKHTIHHHHHFSAPQPQSMDRLST